MWVPQRFGRPVDALIDDRQPGREELVNLIVKQPREHGGPSVRSQRPHGYALVPDGSSRVRVTCSIVARRPDVRRKVAIIGAARAVGAVGATWPPYRHTQGLPDAGHRHQRARPGGPPAAPALVCHRAADNPKGCCTGRGGATGATLSAGVGALKVCGEPQGPNTSGLRGLAAVDG